MRNSVLFAADAQPHPSAKAKSCQQQRNAGKLLGEKIQCRSNVTLLPYAAVVLPSAQASATKIETQHGQAERIHRFRSLVNHFIVHRPAKKRMRMTDNGRKRRPMPLPSRRR